MLWKDLGIGKYVTNNRYYFNKYLIGNGNLLKIVELPQSKKDKLVTCKLVCYDYYFNREKVIRCSAYSFQIPYTYLIEIKDGISFMYWKAGDIIVPSELGIKNTFFTLKKEPYIITLNTADYCNEDAKIIAKRIGGNDEETINPVYFERIGAVIKHS